MSMPVFPSIPVLAQDFVLKPSQFDPLVPSNWLKQYLHLCSQHRLLLFLPVYFESNTGNLRLKSVPNQVNNKKSLMQDKPLQNVLPGLATPRFSIYAATFHYL